MDGNIRQGKIGAAIADGIGVLLDAAAVLTPFVPGGVSAAISAARAVDRVDDIVDFNKVTNTLTDVKGKRIQPNEGVAKPHGKADHNEVIDSIISDLKNDDNNKNIRKNQKQVDSQGNTVGNNRPDIQWDNNDVHHNLEVDRSIKNNNKHEVVIKKNDPNSIFHGKVL